MTDILDVQKLMMLLIDYLRLVRCRKSVLSIGPVTERWSTGTSPSRLKGRRRARATQCVTSWSPTTGWERTQTAVIRTTSFFTLKLRKLRVTSHFRSAPSVQENKARAVRQFHFHGWPEVGIPTDGKGMINIIAAVQKQQQQSGNHPITVHCR